MKKVKNYIDPETAKKKLSRYKFWSIKDENGIIICTSEENNPEDKTFSEILDGLIEDKVDVEIQIKYGTNEQSSRHNAPLFIRIKEPEPTWVDPEEEPTVSINGVTHRVDRNGNVNVNLNQETPHTTIEQQTPFWREEMDMRLEGIRQEHALKEEKMNIELHNKLFEQSLKFKELLLAERENRVREREEILNSQLAELDQRQDEIDTDFKNKLKKLPNILGEVFGAISAFSSPAKQTPLAGAEDTRKETKKPARKDVSFTVIDEEEPEDNFLEEDPPELESEDTYEEFEEEDFLEDEVEELPTLQETEDINPKPEENEND